MPSGRSQIVLPIENMNYRKRGNASYIVREWLLWVVQRERDACDVNRYHAEIARDHAYDYLDGASTLRIDAFWLVLSLLSAQVHVKTRGLALKRSSSRVECLMNDDREGEALRSLVSLPWSSISLACFKQEEYTKLMFISFSNGNGSALENSLDSGRISFRKCPCTMYKDNAVGNVVAEMGKDLVFGTTEWSFIAVERRGSTLTWTVCTAADSEKR